MYTIEEVKAKTHAFQLKNYPEPKTKTTPPKDPLSKKQRAIVDTMKGSDYGCQRGRVAKLISLMMDIPITEFKEAQNQRHRVEVQVPNGTAICFVETGYGVGIKIPVIKLCSGTVMRINNTLSGINYRIYKKSIRPATPAEIDILFAGPQEKKKKTTKKKK